MITTSPPLALARSACLGMPKQEQNNGYNGVLDYDDRISPRAVTRAWRVKARKLRGTVAWPSGPLSRRQASTAQLPNQGPSSDYKTGISLAGWRQSVSPHI